MDKETAMNILKALYDKSLYSERTALETLIPELKEIEDERIRKAIIGTLPKYGYLPQTTIKAEDALAWLEKQGQTFTKKDVDDAYLKGISDTKHELEKQGNIDKAFYEIAEKEKYDFVSGRFIKCRKSFDKFKEDTSYWLEYVGNDNYIGRSDNILNQKFHITPRQLYRLFTQEHCPKENNVVNEETNAPIGYGKYVDECLNEASKHFFSEGEDKYSVADLFYAGVRCGKSWLEKQKSSSSVKWQKNTPDNKPAINHSVLMKTTHGVAEGYFVGSLWFQFRWSSNIKDSDVLAWMELSDLDAQGVQKPTSDIKYKVSAGGSLSIVNGKPFDYEHATITQKDFAPKQELKEIEDEIEIPFGAKDSELQEVTYYIPKGFHAEIEDDKVVIKKGEKSIAWSEEDENMFCSLSNALARISSNTRTDSTSINYSFFAEIDWLKSLKDRVQPQSKIEWSEKDKEMAEDLIKGFQSPGKACYLAHTSKEIADWLKSIKSKLQR